MNKKLLLLGIFIATLVVVFKVSTSNSAIEEVRLKHAEFIENHPYQETLKLSKKDRKANGLPPNKFLEQQHLNEMSPLTGKTYPEKVMELRKQLAANKPLGRTPGDATDNPWIERGPNNVGGRVRAVMFDPTDASNETVFAGGVSGGLWKNTNISSSSQVWERVDIPDNLAISSITFDPNNTSTFYIGTGESYTAGDSGNGDGIWKSTDAGTSWTRIFGGSSGVSYFQEAATITINSPIGIAGDYSVAPTTGFGSSIFMTLTSQLVLVNDGSAAPTEGCNPSVNAAALNGNIALVRRGSCNFTDKVKNAEDAGAIAVIVMNNQDTAPFAMGGSDPTITIPSAMISKTDGDLLEQAVIAGTVNISMTPAEAPFSGVVLPGAQTINDIIARNNNGVTEIFAAVSDSRYRSANVATLVGPFSFGLVKSVDGGATWTEVNLPKPLDANKLCPNNIEIGADGKVWVSTTNSYTYGDGGGAVYSSADGTNFTKKYQVTNGRRTQIATSKTNANKVYILAQLSAGGSVITLRTDDDFATVTTLALPNDADTGISADDFTRGQAGYDLMLEVDPSNDDIAYVGGIDLFKSTDTGTSWNQISHWYGGFGFQNVHADQHGLAFANGDNTKMVFGNDGGVYYSNNNGVNILARNNGLNITQFYTVGVAPTTAIVGDNFVAGAQDNGTQLFQDSNAGIDGSAETQGGDGAYSFFDQDGTDQYYIANYVFNDNINLYNLSNGSVVSINSESLSNGSFINEEALDSNLDILYSNYSNSTDGFQLRRYSGIKDAGTLTKTILTDPLLAGSPRALQVSPFTTTSSTLLVGTLTGVLLKVDNADTTPVWSDITGPEFFGSISDVEYGQTENDIFVTMHNFNVVNVWYSNDGGSSWTNIEGNLPDLPVKAILQNPLNTNELIIGTELGVWATDDFNTGNPIEWTHSYNGMSNVRVLDLDLRDDNVVFASTYGRGIFSGQFTGATASVEDVVQGTKKFSVYPSVSDGNFTVFAKNTLGKADMYIHSINGQEAYKSTLDFNSKEKHQVSLHLSAGMYIVNLVDSNNNKSSQKIIIN